MLKKSQFKRGEFLYGIPSNEESAKYNPDGQRVFIHNGYISDDGYGILIGYEDGELVHSTGWNNFMWGGDVRRAAEEEIEKFMSNLMDTDNIPYRH